MLPFLVIFIFMCLGDYINCIDNLLPHVYIVCEWLNEPVVLLSNDIGYCDTILT